MYMLCRYNYKISDSKNTRETGEKTVDD